jgi:sigma-54 dependent transcriptional regulator, acetoin dehydrogenase operon transcriptional activator AcoR
MSGTVSIHDERDPRLRALEPEPTLIVALLGSTPLAPPSRHTLSGIDVVRIGRAARRGDERRAVRAGDALDLAIDDAAMSTKHAVLRRSGAGFRLEDAGSKNGILVAGGQQLEAPKLLAEGEVFVLGHTAFLFQAAFPTDREARDRPDVTAAELVPPEPLLATFVAPLARTFDVLRVVAGSEVPIVASGESGTGKEVIAHATHTLSRRTGRLVAVDCGAIPAGLVESELFGHRRGAFSGATEDRPGLVRAASGGTLFLDEIGNLPPAAQATLLRALQEREITPLGATHPVKVDFRLVSATHADLGAAVTKGTFRADLLARLSGIVIPLPPLRERRPDLGIIVASLLVRIAGRSASAARFSVSGVRFLFEHDFPANVRELEHLLTTAVLLAEDGPVTAEHFQTILENRQRIPGETSVVPGRAADLEDDDVLRAKLVALFQEHGGNVSAVARSLGKARFQVQRWMRRLRIDPTDPR